MNRLLFFLLVSIHLQAQTPEYFPIAPGWAQNSINTVVFRKNSLVTWKDSQFVAYYNNEQVLVLGKRKLGERKWVLKETVIKANAKDAHNSISIMADGRGYLHCSWGQHNNSLNYRRSLSPGSLELGPELSMTGWQEQQVSYPEFYRLANGDLLFLYREGASGKGNLVVNRYDLNKMQWQQLHSSLIDGEGLRNAYWQACIDDSGYIHISWVWRESPDVASNHDLCYAVSKDGGLTWMNAAGNKYSLPIKAGSAETIVRIPSNSNLINQTSMCVAGDIPIIATYWKDKGSWVTQYHVVYKQGNEWKWLMPFSRKVDFNLSGMGTKRIPIARPQVVARKEGGKNQVFLIFRDEERGNKVSIAMNMDFPRGDWEIKDWTEESVGSWEPSIDTELWRVRKELALFVQKVVQTDNEGVTAVPPQTVAVLTAAIHNTKKKKR